MPGTWRIATGIFSSIMLYFLKRGSYATGSAVGECERSPALAMSTSTKEFT
jgi:hypothetical protein